MNTTRRNPAELRTLAQARRAPQWQRLIDSLSAAEMRAGFSGRQFGRREMESFRSRLVGMPWEAPFSAAVYWAERMENEHSDGSIDVLYVVKVWRPGESALTERIAEQWIPSEDYTPQLDADTALDFARRAAFQVGGEL